MATICGAGVGCKPSASATTSQTTQTTPVVRPVQNFEHIAITLPNPAMKTLTTLLLTCLLTACGSVQYQPLATIDHIDHSRGYRLQNLFQNNQDDDLLLVLLISGGGSRAAAFGYGVLEVLAATPITGHGVSGGSVLATYLALHGKETVPRFEREFLQQNLQSTVLRQLFSLANLPRLTSPQYGRGDLLAEELDRLLYHGATFADLATRRKGPFALISATDMSIGQRIEFTQEHFDALCLDLAQMPVARAVAASSAVPLIFAPITLNNHGGHCRYTPPPLAQGDRDTLARYTAPYQNSAARPYIHLLDGGLTDNLGLHSILDYSDIHGDALRARIADGNIRDIIVISINAQNRLDSTIDQSPDIPGLRDVAAAIINVPIDQNTEQSIRNFQRFTDTWNQHRHTGTRPTLHYINLDLNDLPDGALKKRVLNIGTTFYLPEAEVRDLRTSAKILLEQNDTWRNLPGRNGNWHAPDDKPHP